ncbi:SEC-C domain-containing protein [Myxococcota bacterium]|nr:SEC-C domain-containing protein [Myxococcota bacterium]
MRKIGPNETCPCGSGKKYKRCCMRNEREENAQTEGREADFIPTTEYAEAMRMLLQESSSPSEISPKLAALFSSTSDLPDYSALKPFQPTALLPSIEPKWRPLPERLLKNQAYSKELLRLLHPEQQRYLWIISEQMNQQTPKAWEQALALLQKIPLAERCKLRGLFLSELNALSSLGRRDAYLQTLLSALLTEGDPFFWFDMGGHLLRLSNEFQQTIPLPTQEIILLCKALQEKIPEQSSPVLRMFLLHCASFFPEFYQELSEKHRIPRLLAEAWRVEHFFPQSPLYGYLLSALVYTTQRLVSVCDLLASWTESLKVGRFLWKRLIEETVGSLHGLFLLLDKQGEPETILAICRELLSIYPNDPHLHYWRGRLKTEEKHSKEKAESFGIVMRQASKLPSICLYEVALWWLSNKEIPPDVWASLQSFEAAIAEEISLQTFFLRMGVLFFRYVRHGEDEDLLQKIEPLLVTYGELPGVTRYAYEHLVMMGRFAEIEPILVHAWEENKAENAFAGALLAVGWASRGETERVRALFASEAEATTYLESLPLVGSQLPQRFELAWGASQLRSGDEAQGMRWLEKVYAQQKDHETALAFLEALFQRLGLLKQSAKDEDNEAFARLSLRFEAISAHLQSTRKEPPQLVFLLCLYHILREEWETARTFLNKIDTAVFDADPSMHPLGFLLYTLTHAGCGEWEEAARAALRFFPTVMERKELQDIFHQFFIGLVDAYAEQQKHATKLERKIQKQEAQGNVLSSLQEEKAKLKQILRKISSEKGTLQKALFDIHQTIQYPEKKQNEHENLLEKKVEEFKKRHQILLREFPYNHREMLLQAERLWWQSALSPRDDHAPVALQFSRVVEWAINHYWVDPLMAFALERGQMLADLPACRSRLLPAQNRLTLGDALRLFYMEVVREKDGKEERQKNAHANEALRILLAAYWSERATPASAQNEQAARYLQEEAVFVLTDLLRLRNRASHAGAILSRTEVGQLRGWVLGDEQSIGLLEAFVRFIRYPSDV